MAGVDSYVKVLLHGEGADGGTVITDSSLAPHTFTVVGTASTSTAQAKFGSASLFLPADGQYITSSDNNDWDVGNQDWTLDFWVKHKTLTDNHYFSQNTSAGVDRKDFCAIYLNELYSAFQGTAFGDQGYWKTAWTTRDTTTWHHVAMVRSGTQPYIFIDGTAQSVTIVTALGSVTPGTSPLKVGALGAAFSPVAWIDELRFSVGTARWTSNFTPPTEAYSSNTNPNKPTNSTPADAATGFPISGGTLTASAFSDPDGGDTHGSSIWQVSAGTAFSTTAWTSNWSTAQLTAATINATNGTYASGTALAYLGTYYWRVQYADDKGGSSGYSDYTSFVTAGSPAAAVTWNSEPVKNIAKAIVDVSKKSMISTTGTVPITTESDGNLRLDLYNNDFYYSSGSAWYKGLKNNSTGTITVGTLGTANIKVGTVSTLVSSTANITLGTFGTITGTVGTINNFVASTINASLGTYGTIIGTVGTVPSLNSSTANIGLGTFGTVIGTVGTVPTLNSSTANIGLGTFGTLVGTVGTIPTFNSSTANIGLATVGIGANNVVLNSTQGLRLNGSATVWEDQMVDIGRLRSGPLGTAPTWGTLNGAEVLQFGYGTVSSVSFTSQIPHSAKVGGSVEYHLHVSPLDNNVGSVFWQFAYSWVGINGTFPTPSTISATQTIGTNSGTTHLLFDIGNIGTNPGISSMLLCSLARIGTIATDTYATTMYLLQSDFHYEKDSIGSDEETSKT